MKVCGMCGGCKTVTWCAPNAEGRRFTPEGRPCGVTQTGPCLRCNATGEGDYENGLPAK